jgi:hypothetical protein
MVLLPLVPRPLGRMRLLLHALHAPAVAQAVQTPTDAPPPPVAPVAPGAPPVAPGEPPAGCEAASDDEHDAALALRFVFHV